MTLSNWQSLNNLFLFSALVCLPIAALFFLFLCDIILTLFCDNLISFCRTDLKFCSCSDDTTVKVWDFARCQEERSLTGNVIKLFDLYSLHSTDN